MQLKENDIAPLFTAVSDSGEKVSLADVIERKNHVVLYFYPKDFTSGCTKESCAFRDNWDRVKSLGATVFGISSDDVESHRKFRERYSLPFTLLSDQDHSIRRMYGVDGRFLPPRVTFVIDNQGRIRSIFNSQLNVTKHIENAILTLTNLKNGVSEGAEKKAVTETGDAGS